MAGAIGLYIIYYYESISSSCFLSNLKYRIITRMTQEEKDNSNTVQEQEQQQ